MMGSSHPAVRCAVIIVWALPPPKMGTATVFLIDTRFSNPLVSFTVDASRHTKVGNPVLRVRGGGARERGAGLGDEREREALEPTGARREYPFALYALREGSCTALVWVSEARHVALCKIPLVSQEFVKKKKGTVKTYRCKSRSI